VAFVIDVFARRIVGRRISNTMSTDFVPDTLEQALYDRHPADSLSHHSDRGVQYVSIRYAERLTQAGIEPSVGSRDDSSDNALAEIINGLYKSEFIHHRAPWDLPRWNGSPGITISTCSYRSGTFLLHRPKNSTTVPILTLCDERCTLTKQPPRFPERFRYKVSD